MKKKPTPLPKCEVSFDQALKFLSKYYSDGFLDLQELQGGKHSRAFSFKHNQTGFVVRFNTEDRGFQKDKFAFEHIGKLLSIPKVIDFGKHSQGIYYCISEKVDGETARAQYNRNDYSSLPILYCAIEDIAKTSLSSAGYGYVDIEGNAPYQSSSEYMRSVYHSTDLFNWDQIFKISFIDKIFTDYVSSKMEYFARYSTEQRELLHGDFGADNVFINDSRVSGIIDWEKMRVGDHFLDVGRVLLFCPDRKATTRAAVEFYKDRQVVNWKERVAMGIYHVVLTNYAYAALAGNVESCKSSPTRLKELEIGLNLV